MADVDLLRTEFSSVREDVAEMKETMRQVAAALERLARLEERHATVSAALGRAFSAVSKTNVRVDALVERVAVLEREQPVQKLASGWVTNGVWLAAGGLVTAALKRMGVF